MGSGFWSRAATDRTADVERLYNAHPLASRSQSLVDSISLDSQIAKMRFRENEFDRSAQDTAVEAFH